MDITRYTTQLKQFRTELYQNITNRADTLIELMDAISSNTTATSVVELSQTACFRRSYSNLYKAIDEWQPPKMLLPHLLNPYLPTPRQKSFWLLFVDVTVQPRPYGHTVDDRGMVYHPTVVSGNKPVTIGHQYSSVVLGLEPEAGVTGSWVLPLLTERVATSQDKEMVGGRQIDALLDDPQLPFGQELCVEAVDSSYSKPVYLHNHRQHANLVTIARVKSNRTFYHQFQPETEMDQSVGHPRWYGDRFKLSATHGRANPDETLIRWETSPQGKGDRAPEGDVQACIVAKLLLSLGRGIDNPHAEEQGHDQEADEGQDGPQLLVQISVGALLDVLPHVLHLLRAFVFLEYLPTQEEGVGQSQEGGTHHAPDGKCFKGGHSVHNRSFNLPR